MTQQALKAAYIKERERNSRMDRRIRELNNECRDLRSELAGEHHRLAATIEHFRARDKPHNNFQWRLDFYNKKSRLGKLVFILLTGGQI